jgi:hypothetical protein
MLVSNNFAIIKIISITQKRKSDSINMTHKS